MADQTNPQPASRVHYWLATLFCSVVVSATSVTELFMTHNDKSNRRSILASGLLLFSCLFSVLAHLNGVMSAIFVGTKVEGFFAGFIMVAWTWMISIVNREGHRLAVDEEGIVRDGNLYYSSWGGFVTSFLLIVAYLRSVMGVDMTQFGSSRITLWGAMLAAQLVLMCVCSNNFHNKCQPNLDEFRTYCNRTKYGLGLGTIGTCISTVMLILKLVRNSVSFSLEFGFTIALVCTNMLGVIFLTGDKGPGARLGNIYYFSWLSMISAFLLLLSCLRQLKGHSTPVPTTPTSENMAVNGNEDDKDIAVESMPEI